MALRLANQINRRIVKNAYRSLSSKREVAEAEAGAQKAEDGSKSATEDSPSPTLTNLSAIQYEVCRPRTSPIKPFPRKLPDENETFKQALALQHLQPAMMPKYYRPPIEINAPGIQVDPIHEADREQATMDRKFETSNTCKNVVLPLKMPKLANPFPEPVKMVIHSNAISDEEKAQQMFAEAKTVKVTANKSMNKQSHFQPATAPLPPSRSYSTGSTARNYSTERIIRTYATERDDKKCKKVGGSARPKCPKRKLQGCPPLSKNISCKRKKAIRPPCTRKYPPYPSYSESCHEDPIERPCESQICPYKPTEHPTFKPAKKHLHTNAAVLVKRKDDCKKPPNKDKKPCGYLKKEENVKQKDANKKQKTPKLEDDRVAVSVRLNPFQSKKREVQMQKEAKKIPTTFKEESQIAPTSTVSLTTEMGSWLNRFQQPEFSPVPIIKVEEADECKKGRCTKFPFKEINFEIVKKRKPKPPVQVGCPKKPKPRIIKDCPGEIEDECKKRFSNMDSLTYLFSNSGDGKKKTTCVDDPHDIPNHPDRCKKERTDHTKICPTDLLKTDKRKRRKNKKNDEKKTYPAVPFNRIPSSYRSDTTINP